MSNRLLWVGLPEFKAALRQLPFELTGDAAGIVERAAKQAHDEIKAAYPTGPGTHGGNLKRGLRVTSYVKNAPPPANATTPSKGVLFGAGATVVNKAPHAWIFENGTEARTVSALVGKKGRAQNFGLTRGSMPPGRVFIPIAIRRRNQMYRELGALLQRAGFQVSFNG